MWVRAWPSKQRFVSDASHELRSPVATIRNHADVALAHPGQTTTELAETVLVEGLRVQRLVEALLVLARIEEHTLGVNRRAIFEEAGRRRATTTLHVEATGVPGGRVSGDLAQLRAMVRNIADNAARHSAMAAARARAGSEVHGNRAGSGRARTGRRG